MLNRLKSEVELSPGTLVAGLAAHRQSKWLMVLLCALLVLTGSFFAIRWSRSPAASEYVTAPVTRGAVTRAVTATGTVNPVLTIIVGTYVSGVIQDLQCDYNTKVSKGQLCAKIDPRPYQTVVDQGRAQLAVAKAQLEKDKAAMAYARAALDRATALVTRDWVSHDAFDQAKANFDQSAAQVELDTAAISQRQAELSAAEVNLGYTDIVSPVDGTVVLRNVTRGQTVAASFQTPTLFLIATDLTEMQVDTNVSESDIGSIKEGNAASFSVESFPDHPFDGSVTQVRQAPQTIQNVVTYDVVVGVKNTDLMLKPGMTATTKIVLDKRDNVLRIPSQAQRYSPADSSSRSERRQSRSTRSIWLLRDSKPLRLDVELGLDDDAYVEVRSGDVKEGDLVILSEQAAAASDATVPRL